MLKQRLITALWGLPLITTVIWFGEPWFTIVIASLGLLAAYEFYRIVSTQQVRALTYLGLIWTLLFIISPHFGYAAATPLLLTSLVMISLIYMLSRKTVEGAYTGCVWTIAGVLYIGWLLSYLVALRGLDAGRYWVFLALFVTFASDSSAYFIGRAWGKHRLAPHISPGKTWEGAVAGALGAIIISLGLVKLFGLPLSYGQVILLGLLVSVFAQLGDLVESLFKRNMSIKESGNFFPGHGGILDRIDSAAFAAVVVYYYALSYQAGWLNWLQ